MKKTELVFNKPVYLVMSVLDLSKTLMYEFHYNYIKKKYGPKATLLMTDTDSLMYEIQGVHKVLHTLKIFISQKPHKVETLNFRQ